MTHGHHHHHHGGGGGGGGHHHHHHGGHHHHGHHHQHHHGGQALPGLPVPYRYLATTTVQAPLLEPRPDSSDPDNGLYMCLACLILAVVFTLFYIFG